MRLFWAECKNGLDLCVADEDGNRWTVGGVRRTKRGIEAMAKTMGYDPGRAVKNIASIEEGKLFVERFEPWREFFPGEPLELESEIETNPKRDD